MHDFLLDLNIIHYWYDPKHKSHDAVVGNIDRAMAFVGEQGLRPKLVVSVVTLGEIEFGRRVQPDDSIEYLLERSKFVHEKLPHKINVTQDDVAAYGEIRSRLFNEYAPGNKRKPGMRPEQLVDPIISLNLQIQENDLWLCAQAVGREIILVTNDAMDPIRAVTPGMDPPLRIQNWTIPKSVVLD